MQLFKNTASQKVRVFAFADAGHATLDAGEPVTGDAAQISAQTALDNAALGASDDVAPTEVDATNAPGYYEFDALQAETNGDVIEWYPKSSTAGVQVVTVGGNVQTLLPPNHPSMGIESDGDLTKVNLVATLTGHTAQTGDNYSVLAAGIDAETQNDTLIERLRVIEALIEHQRGAHTHQPIGEVFFVDPTNGDTHASGNRGGITDPYSLVQDCHDNAVTDSNHDLIILLSGAAAGPTTLTEDVTLSKRYLFIRGPGRDFIWTRSGSGDTITITADGVALEGFQVNTAATGAGNGITVTSADFFKACNLWLNDTRGDAIELTDSDNFVVDRCVLQGSGQSGSGHGIQVLAGGGESSDYGRISHCVFHDVDGEDRKSVV